jgi:hypothetical protein
MLQWRLGAKRFCLLIALTNLWGACAACVDDAMVASFTAESESGVVLGSWFGWLVT